jgi:hypothetical protein
MADGRQEPDEGGRGPAWTGRPLRLPYAPDAEHAAVLAEHFVAMALRVAGLRLDYSVESLKALDALLDGFGAQGSDAVAESVYDAGCYVGEVLVRQGGYRWVDLADDERWLAEMFGFRLVVVGPRGSYSNPIGKAFKLVEGGITESVWFLVHADLAADDRESP